MGGEEPEEEIETAPIVMPPAHLPPPHLAPPPVQGSAALLPLPPTASPFAPWGSLMPKTGRSCLLELEILPKNHWFNCFASGRILSCQTSLVIGPICLKRITPLRSIK